MTKAKIASARLADYKLEIWATNASARFRLTLAAYARKIYG